MVPGVLPFSREQIGPLKKWKSLSRSFAVSLSDNTIRKLFLEESQTMEDWQNNDAASHKPFREAEGEIEF